MFCLKSFSFYRKKSPIFCLGPILQLLWRELIGGSRGEESNLPIQHADFHLLPLFSAPTLTLLLVIWVSPNSESPYTIFSANKFLISCKDKGRDLGAVSIWHIAFSFLLSFICLQGLLSFQILRLQRAYGRNHPTTSYCHLTLQGLLLLPSFF